MNWGVTREMEWNKEAYYSSGTIGILVKGLAWYHVSWWGFRIDALSISPASISSLTSFGLRPSTWHPTLNAVPKISLTVPFRSFARLLNLIVLAMSMISSRGMDLVCFIFFSFFRSRGGSLSALITREDADGTTETAAWRFWMVSLTVTLSPFCRSRGGVISSRPTQ